MRGREPADPRLAVWRFRTVALVVLVLSVLAVIAAFNHLNGANRQDPSFVAPTPVPSAS